MAMLCYIEKKKKINIHDRNFPPKTPSLNPVLNTCISRCFHLSCGRESGQQSSSPPSPFGLIPARPQPSSSEP
ncbi:hypothetical protein BDZ91DRAFT_740020, partial [Kalaharituber pfeilii]